MSQFFYGYVLKNSQCYYVGRKGASDVGSFDLTKNCKSVKVYDNLPSANSKLESLSNELDKFAHLKEIPDLIEDFQTYPVYLKIGE